MSFDAVYRSTESWFGPGPEPLLRDHVHRMDSSRPVLDVGMGQGRNAVWLAQRGFSVDGLEPSTVGIEAVSALVAAEGLSVHSYPCGFEDFEAQAPAYGTVLALGLAPLLSAEGFDLLARRIEGWLGPGGLLFITAFTVQDPGYETIARHWTRVATHSFVDARGDRRTYLEAGELPRRFPAYECLHHWEGMGPEHAHGDGPVHRHALCECILRRPTAV
jgi:SAM-dependent methyltransferase